MHRRGDLHTLNVLGAAVDVLARELKAVETTAAGGPGGRAAALTALAAFCSGSPIQRLAHSLGLSHSRTVRLVDRLEAEHLVTRTRDDDNRRNVHVSLTASGRQLAESITAARLESLRPDLETLDRADRAALERISAMILARRITHLTAAEETCRLCDPEACGHPDRCPVTRAADAYR